MYRVFPPFLLLALLTPAQAKPPYTPSSGQSALYVCGDGRTIEVLYSGGDAAVLTIGDTTVQMDRAPAPNGELYVGGGWRWWGQSPREGSLAKADGPAGGIFCHVR